MSREHVNSDLATVENILQGTYSGLVDNGEVENWKWLGGQVVIILSPLITSSLSHNDDRSVAEDANVTLGMMVNSQLFAEFHCCWCYWASSSRDITPMTNGPVALSTSEILIKFLAISLLGIQLAIVQPVGQLMCNI